MSVITTSGSSSSTAASSDEPSPTARTTSISGAEDRMSSTASRTRYASSAITTRIGRSTGPGCVLLPSVAGCMDSLLLDGLVLAAIPRGTLAGLERPSTATAPVGDFYGCD